MNENIITISPLTFAVSILTSLVCVVILLFVLRTQIRQFQTKSDLQRMKVFLTVMISSLLLANAITLALGVAYVGKPIPASIVEFASTVNRFNALITTISLGLVYKFQISDSQKK